MLESEPRSARLGFALLLSLLALVAVGKVMLGDTLDPDAFWHMRVGAELSKQSWPGPLVDDLSFASVREPWTPYSWLAERGMKELWDVGGYRAVIVVQAAMEAAFVVLLGLGALELSATVCGKPRYLASAVGAAFGGVLSLAYLSFRPVTAALVLLALIGWIVLRDRRLRQKSKLVWIVPIITALLINIHFFALFVPVWMTALFVGDLIQRPRTAMRGFALLLSTLCACLCTPLLRGMIKSVTDYATNDVMVRSATIAEFGPFYHGAFGNIAAAMVGITAVCMLWHVVREPKIDFGIVFWFAFSAIVLFRMGRMAPVFAIIAAPVFAATIPGLSDLILTRHPVVAALGLVAVLMVYPIARAFPPNDETFSTWLNRNGPDAPHYPCSAADYVEANVSPRTHHLLCDFTWGGFLEWRLGDRYQTLMDGRTQLFTPQFWTNAALGSAEERRQFLASQSADAAVVRTGESKLRGDLQALGWKNVYADQFGEVWVPGAKPEIRNPNDESISKSE